MRVVTPLAEKARAERKPAKADNPFLRIQEQVSEIVTASLEAFGSCATKRRKLSSTRSMARLGFRVCWE